MQFRVPFLLFSFVIFSVISLESRDLWVSFGVDTLETVRSRIPLRGLQSQSPDGIVLAQIDAKYLAQLSHIMHTKFRRCGGFIVHESLMEGRQLIANIFDRDLATKGLLAEHTIDQGERLVDWVKELKAENITETIRSLSTFKNRYYQSPTGVESQEWIQKRWCELAAGREDVKVEFFKHGGWIQPSIILTIKGRVKPDEIVVAGGHADSIQGYFGGAGCVAPGADDNASGISTLTEVLRLLMEKGYSPEKTVQFMAYSAEEVGLRGSREIAKKYKSDQKQVCGVLQLDMTNFKNHALDIVMMSDFTNHPQNEYLGKLIDTYVHVPWGFSTCGYACSDHASWTAEGYPSSHPFETEPKAMNPNIHTTKDLIEVSGGHANHTLPFARLALAFIVEMAK